jgi:hypothetical protein
VTNEQAERLHVGLAVILLILIGFVAALMLAGCDENPVQAPKQTHFVAQGWVLSLERVGDHHFGVNFAGEDGSIFTLQVYTKYTPPVWAGLHCQIAFEKYPDESGDVYNFKVLKRLP